MSARKARVSATEVALFIAMVAVLLIVAAVLWPVATGKAPPPGSPRAAAAPVARSDSTVNGAWRTGPELAIQRSEVAAAVAGPDGAIYVLGGLAADGRSLAAVEALPPGAAAWQTRAPLPEPRDHLAAVELGGQLYAVAGSPGWFGQQTSATLWVYDPVTDSWAARAPLPLGRAAHAAAVIDGKLYVAGGIGPEAQRLLVYDPATDAWVVKSAMSRPREHLAAAAAGGKLYVVGGRWGDVGNVDLLEEYDPATDQWRTLPPMPTARGGLAAAALGGRIFVTGGEVLDASRVTFPQLEVFHPETGQWTSAPPLPTARHGLAAVARGGELYVLAGGRLAGLEVSGLVEIFTPDA